MHTFYRLFIGILLSAIGTSLSTVCSAQLVAEARDGNCHLVVEGQGEVFTVHVEGLKPGESLQLESTSEGESLTSAPSADADGSYGVALFPAVQGKTSGNTTVSVTSSRCRLKVTFPWQLQGFDHP